MEQQTVALRQVGELPEATWPGGPHPQMLHLDLTVPTVTALEAEHHRALGLGARLLRDRSDDPEEPLRVYAIRPGTRSASSLPRRRPALDVGTVRIARGCLRRAGPC